MAEVSSQSMGNDFYFVSFKNRLALKKDGLHSKIWTSNRFKAISKYFNEISVGRMPVLPHFKGFKPEDILMFGGQWHEIITEEGFDLFQKYTKKNNGLTRRLKSIKRRNLGQDAKFDQFLRNYVLGKVTGEETFKRHFVTSKEIGPLRGIEEGLDYLDELRDKYRQSDYDSLGRALHSIQDFYSHTNYVDIIQAPFIAKDIYDIFHDGFPLIYVRRDSINKVNKHYIKKFNIYLTAISFGLGDDVLGFTRRKEIREKEKKIKEWLCEPSYSAEEELRKSIWGVLVPDAHEAAKEMASRVWQYSIPHFFKEIPNISHYYMGKDMPGILGIRYFYTAKKLATLATTNEFLIFAGQKPLTPTNLDPNDLIIDDEINNMMMQDVMDVQFWNWDLLPLRYDVLKEVFKDEKDSSVIFFSIIRMLNKLLFHIAREKNIHRVGEERYAGETAKILYEENIIDGKIYLKMNQILTFMKTSFGTHPSHPFYVVETEKVLDLTDNVIKQLRSLLRKQ